MITQYRSDVVAMSLDGRLGNTVAETGTRMLDDSVKYVLLGDDPTYRWSDLIDTVKISLPGESCQVTRALSAGLQQILSETGMARPSIAWRLY